jgi:type III secretion apparatus needle protein
MAPLNMDDVFSKLGSSTETLESDIKTKLGSFDPSDPAAMIEMQLAMQKWTIATQVQSNTIKTIGEGIKSTVQNMR